MEEQHQLKGLIFVLLLLFTILFLSGMIFYVDEQISLINISNSTASNSSSYWTQDVNGTIFNNNGGNVTTTTIIDIVGVDDSIARYDFENNADLGEDTHSNYDGTNNGATQTTGVNGTYGAYFDGTDYITADLDLKTVGDSNYTISWWAKNDVQLNSYPFIAMLSWGGIMTDTSPYVYIKRISTTQVEVFVNGGTRFTLNVANGNWNHYAFSLEGTTWTMYLDGVNKGTYTASINNAFLGDTLYLGAGYNQKWTGWMDEFQYFDFALNQTEITKVYTFNATTIHVNETTTVNLPADAKVTNDLKVLNDLTVNNNTFLNNVSANFIDNYNMVAQFHREADVIPANDDTWYNITWDMYVADVSIGDFYTLTDSNSSITINGFDGILRVQGCLHPYNDNVGNQDASIYGRVLVNNVEARCLQVTSSKSFKSGIADIVDFDGTVTVEDGDVINVQWRSTNTDLQLQGSTVFDTPVSASVNFERISLNP